MENILKLFLLSILLISSANAVDYVNGEVKVIDENKLAWDEKNKKFVTLKKFLENYMERNSNKVWKQSRNYPNYNDVKEYDLFMVEIDAGICLMEFYHERWRRANDVRRWDPAFNEFSGCAHVFD